MLLSVLLFSVLRLCLACMSNEHYFGRLSADLVIEQVTLPAPSSSCGCCGLCHQRADCRSFSFDTERRECTLYDRVGNFSQVSDLFESSVQFFFMPNSSDSGEFCRSDGDCQTPGDFCSGRICTKDETVTCRDIYGMNSALTSGYYWGSIRRQEFLLRCLMVGTHRGYTMLLNYRQTGWTSDNWMYRVETDSDSCSYPDLECPYSILRFADIVRDSGSGNFYQVFVRGAEFSSSRPDGQPGTVLRGLRYNVTRDYSLLGTTPREAAHEPTDGPFSLPRGGRLVFPYITAASGRPYSLNGNQDRGQRSGTLVEVSDAASPLRPSHAAHARGGTPWVEGIQDPTYVRLFIRE